MLPFDLVLGVLAAAFGCFTVFCYVTRNEKVFAKKEAMKKAYGEKAGTVIHFVSYAVIPLVIGVLFLLKSFFAR